MPHLLPEHLLIARLHVDRLIAQQRFSDAANAGSRALVASEALLSNHAAAEKIRLAHSLTRLGMLSGVTLDYFENILKRSEVDAPALSDAVAAMKTLSDDRFDQWLQALERAAPRGSPNALELLDAACAHMDAGVAPALLSSSLATASIRDALGATDESARARGLEVLGRMLRGAPVELCDRLVPVFTTAALVESPALQAYALATLGDVACALALVPGSHERSEAVIASLAPSLKLLSACLYSPRLEIQQIAALALAKLVLHGNRRSHRLERRERRERRAQRTPRGRLDDASDTSESESEGDAVEEEVYEEGADVEEGASSSCCCLEECTDAERLVADLAFRYTAEMAAAPAPANAAEKAAEKARAAAVALLMQTLLAAFEVLRERPVEVSNAIVWIVLGAVEDGSLGEGSSGGGVGSVGADLDAPTTRCLRFLTSLVDREWESRDARSAAVSSLVKATVLNVGNLHGLDIGGEDVARWLGVQLDG